ncbi:D-galactonate regulator IclR family [Vibrio variabilis]|uniref:D-galactonate regulator IclR family n=2 Tax=Vibrio TaxID=662 RepID=A0ABQ0JGH8_9VIBR|nr:D-galactonate regulator IclR family [Vibrio variabilis]
MPLKELARPHLQELSSITQDTVHLGIRDEDEVFYLEKVPGQRPIELRSKVGERRSLAGTGIGKALMIDLPKTEWQRLNGLAPNLVLKDTLTRMEHYSQYDYCFDLEDNEELVRCVASPIRNKYGNIIAAISVTSIKTYMPESRMNNLIHVVQDYAKRISNSIG